MSLSPIPEDYPRITPYLVLNDIAACSEFLITVFDAEVTQLIKQPDGSPMHMELQLGDSKVMLGRAQENFPALPAMMYLFVEDTDATYRKALEHGGTSMMEPADQFYGDRNAGIRGPQGNIWWLASRVEIVTPEELQKRADKMAKESAS